MGLKEEVIQNVKKMGFDPEQVRSLIEEIDEILAYEDSLDKQTIKHKKIARREDKTSEKHEKD